MANHWVYVIKSTSGHYKIGHSNDPDRRLGELQKTQGPYEYSLMVKSPFANRRIAKKVESALHDAYDEWRVNGEWFELPEAMLVALGMSLEYWHANENRGGSPKCQDAFDSGVGVGRRLAEYPEVTY